MVEGNSEDAYSASQTPDSKFNSICLRLGALSRIGNCLKNHKQGIMTRGR